MLSNILHILNSHSMRKQENTIIGIKVLALIMIMISLIALSACVSKPKAKKDFDPITNAKELGKALGCVFAPHTCKSAEEKIKEEKAFQEEFKKIDEQLQKESKTTPKQ